MNQSVRYFLDGIQIRHQGRVDDIFCHPTQPLGLVIEEMFVLLSLPIGDIKDLIHLPQIAHHGLGLAEDVLHP